VGASVIIVATHSAETARAVAKYRPEPPVLVLVVPRIVSDGLRWHLHGRHQARQCLLTHGLHPCLLASQLTGGSVSGDAALEEAVAQACRHGLARPSSYAGARLVASPPPPDAATQLAARIAAHRAPPTSLLLSAAAAAATTAAAQCAWTACTARWPSRWWR